MFSLEQYVKENIALTKSLVIKVADLANAVNKGILLNPMLHPKYKDIPRDKRGWKYYMNLAGEKHPTNSNVEVLVIDDGVKRPLTKELLKNYKYTREELLKCSSYYEELINEYPEDIMYIHGCMYPVDKEKAIKAKDGTILAHNPNFVYENEYSVIEELERYCKDFLARWHIREYTIVEELYLPAMLSVLYTNIPNKLMAIRLDKAGTKEVHPFHMEHFFRSYLGLWDDLELLNNKSKFWLYNNLLYIRNNVGKTHTLGLIIDKILTPNKVGIGNYTLRKPMPKLSYTDDIFASTYTQSDLLSLSANLNPYYTTDNNKSSDIATLIERELVNSDGRTKEEDIERNDFIIKEAVDIVKHSYVDNQKTKLLEVSTYNLFKRQGVDLFKLIMDQWLFSLSVGKLNYICEYLEINNNKTYICSPYIGFLMLFKLILKKLNLLDMPLQFLNYDTVVNPDKTILNKAYEFLYKDKVSEFAKNELLKNYPSNNILCNSVDDFKSIILNMIDFYSYAWTLDTNLENSLGSANMKTMLQYITTSGKFDITNPMFAAYSNTEAKTIDEILAENNVVYEVNDTFDISVSISELIRTFTGVTLDETVYIRKISEGFKNIIDRLTSYTTKCFMAPTGENSIFLHYNNTNIFKSNIGVIRIDEAIMKPLEPEFTYITSLSNEFEDTAVADITVGSFTKAGELPKYPFKGFFEVYKNEGYATTCPNVGVEIMKHPIVDISEVEWKQQFITNVKFMFSGIEPNKVTLDSTRFTNDIPSPVDNIPNDNNNNISAREVKEGVEAIGYMPPDVDRAFTSPTLQANIEQNVTIRNKGEVIRVDN